MMRLDAWVSCAVYTVATVAFYFLGAAILHGGQGKELPGNIGGMLEVLTRMYVPVLGAKAATVFIVIGAFAVLYSTLFAATGANSRVIADFMRVNRFVFLNLPILQPREPSRRNGFASIPFTCGLRHPAS